jgi:predicted secreted protein
MGQAIAGIGTIINRWDGSQWVPIANINSASGPGSERTTIDVTTLDSTGGYREFITGLRDGGEFTFGMNFVIETYLLIKDDFEDNDLQQYSVVFPDDESSTIVFDGIVTGFPLDIPLDDKVTCNVTIKISGEPDVTSILKITAVAAIVDIPAANGTQLADVGLPSTVTVTLSDLTTPTPAVAWDTGDPMYDGDTAGVYTFTGTITPPTGSYNPDGLTAEVDVVVGT